MPVTLLPPRGDEGVVVRIHDPMPFGSQPPHQLVGRAVREPKESPRGPVPVNAYTPLAGVLPGRGAVGHRVDEEEDVSLLEVNLDGDTIRIETEVLELRDSKSRPDNGIAIFRHRAYNQHDDLVGECKRTALMLKKPL